MLGPRGRKARAHHSVEKNRKRRSKNRDPQLEEFFPEAFLISNLTTAHGSNSLEDGRDGKDATKEGWSDAKRGLVRDVVKGGDVRNEGAKVKVSR